jgi:carnitine O-acetyltransferase
MVSHLCDPCLAGKISANPSSCIILSGRTEAMRAATLHASNFCKLWLDRLATKKEKLEALRVATEHHSAGIKLSASGKGLERHLFALMKIAEKNGIPTPDFFSSVAYKELNHTVLSTSNCGNPSLRLFGFGPVVQDGFGIGYIIRDNGIQYSISSKHRQTKRYASTLNKTLFDMGDLLKSFSSVTVSSDPVTTEEKIVDAQYYSYGDAPGESRAGTGSSTERQTLARVLHRQPSVRASELSRFGQLLTPSLSAEGEEDRGK